MDIWNAYPEIKEELQCVEEYMIAHTTSKKKILTDISRDLIMAGGKRIRPGFVILAAKLGTYKRDKVIPMAASIELLHTATLVHDDIIDESHVRRGKPTVQAKWGKDMAVYTGDFLFTKAFMMLSSKDSFKHLSFIARAMKEICEGEVSQYETKYNQNTTVFEYLKRSYRKTAVLFGMSMVIGGYESGCKKKVLHALGKFGGAYGMIFQMKDDLLDYEGTEENIGKPIGNDIREGMYTLPLLYALEDVHVKDEIKALLDKKQFLSKEEIDQIIVLVKQSDGIDRTKELAHKFYKKAKQALAQLPRCTYTEIMQKMVDQISM